ncbi:NUDIX hydrolase [Bacillus sp. B15-48]|uniref:NUDIX domain-containing protein n=1 Tax=Bacillus sp. B15-48 TaxID=1548601 RepID=UPI00193FC5C0|nr:NUDIX domain-containing protein [Bacillus sp. B15-48]
MFNIPKPASTVLLIDEKIRVYLTKRPKTMKVLAGYHVFPGGSVENEDSVMAKNFIRNWHDSQQLGLGHYVAAIRELFEEVGIFLGKKNNGTPFKLSSNEMIDYRRLLINQEISFSEMLKQENLHLDFSHLTYFGHRITPKYKPIRFDTRFFLAKLPNGQSPKPERFEIDDASWMTPEEALSSYEIGKMLLASPTIESLRTLCKYQTGEKPMMPLQRQNPLAESK